MSKQNGFGRTHAVGTRNVRAAEEGILFKQAIIRWDVMNSSITLTVNSLDNVSLQRW